MNEHKETKQLTLCSCMLLPWRCCTCCCPLLPPCLASTHLQNLDFQNPVKQIYTQLTGVMSKVFFPGSDPAVQALSIWGIFAGELQQLSYLQI
jgi:hypothetical protein